jgi:prepilin peptidase CpaA
MAFSFTLLGVATIDDVMTGKIHNVLLGIFAVVGLALAFFVGGLTGMKHALLGGLTGFLMYLPMAWLKIVGGGDLKLLTVLGLNLDIRSIVAIGVLALFWAAALGLLHVLLKKQLKDVVLNFQKIFKREKVDQSALHKIPYSAALLLATLTQWSLHRMGGSFI